MGVVESRWAPRSSKPLRGAAEVALVGSTPIHSRRETPFQIQEGRQFCYQILFTGDTKYTPALRSRSLFLGRLHFTLHNLSQLAAQFSDLLRHLGDAFVQGRVGLDPLSDEKSSTLRTTLADIGLD